MIFTEVEIVYQCSESVGLWLEELGFNVGDCVRIKCNNGQLVIGLNEEIAQENVAEKSF